PTASAYVYTLSLHDALPIFFLAAFVGIIAGPRVVFAHALGRNIIFSNVGVVLQPRNHRFGALFRQLVIIGILFGGQVVGMTFDGDLVVIVALFDIIGN